MFIRLKKSSKLEGVVIVVHGEFSEKLGSYSRDVNTMNLAHVFVDVDRLSYWLAKGASCDMPAFKLLQEYLNMMIKNKL